MRTGLAYYIDFRFFWLSTKKCRQISQTKVKTKTGKKICLFMNKHDLKIA